MDKPCSDAHGVRPAYFVLISLGAESSCIRHGLDPGQHKVVLVSNPRIPNIRQATQVFSPYFRTPAGWIISYSVWCTGRRGRIVVNIENDNRNPANGNNRILDRMLLRSGRKVNVDQRENVAGTLRLNVESSCSFWRVSASGSHLQQVNDSG